MLGPPGPPGLDGLYGLTGPKGMKGASGKRALYYSFFMSFRTVGILSQLGASRIAHYLLLQLVIICEVAHF